MVLSTVPTDRDCLTLLSVIVRKYWLNQLKGEGDCLGSQCQASVHRGRGVTMVETPEGAGHIAPVVKRQRDKCMLRLSLFSPFYTVQGALPSSSPAPSYASRIN